MATKAVVLAAGLGTRLRPFTCSVPKPLLPVWGEPMLARVVSTLRGMGVSDIAVNCHYLAGQVEAWCRANGCRAFFEPEILGTGGVLNPLRDWIGDDDFYLVNGDIVIENLPPLKLAGGDEIAVAAVTEQGPRTIEVEPESGFVTCWRSPDPGWNGTFTYCGFALLKAEILRYVKPEGFSSIVEAYERAMADGRFVRAVTADDFLWTDAGSVESYLDINGDGDENAYGDIPQLKAAFGDGAAVSLIGARGSDRVFFRSSGKVAVVYDDSKRGENAKYAAHARWLASKGVGVPAVLAEYADAKTLVLEDAGEERTDLESRVKAVEALARFNGLDFSEIEASLEPPMDAAMWKWERELFSEHCLKSRFSMEMPPDVKAELEAVAARLEREPRALVHRDFQSTNVLWKGGEARFIDFQGMRAGPQAYDLASFVYDPYVKTDERHRLALVKVYAGASGRGDIAEVLPFASVERLIQCLGAYGRLAAVGRPEFGRYVAPALENLLAAADEAGLDAVGALAEELIHLETHSSR
jgi:aminoglycoside/choline kinase family phosphotransferase